MRKIYGFEGYGKRRSRQWLLLVYFYGPLAEARRIDVSRNRIVNRE